MAVVYLTIDQVLEYHTDVLALGGLAGVAVSTLAGRRRPAGTTERVW
jgi:hypothetical protein